MVGFEVEALLCGVVMGFLICFTGVGGGVLVIPALALIFNLPVSVAIGTASVYTALTKIVAGAEHARIGNVNYRLFVVMAASAAPGILIAAGGVNYLLSRYPDGEPFLQTALKAAVIFAIALSLLLAVLRTEKNGRAPPRGLALGAGAGIGLMMGATGIGGGVLIVPALLLLGRETPKRVVGTSIVIALSLSTLTALIYAGGGQVDWPLALWMSAGALLGIPLGSRLLQKASQTLVRRGLLGLIAVSLLLMLASG